MMWKEEEGGNGGCMEEAVSKFESKVVMMLRRSKW